ncbi:lytic transglycosylase F [Desulfovibrio gilichinskyi]|uniref:Membrane-bound lytic murein transglycosylase MltF n=1 Tax=Desulfovibrio gilichinskyi TaxID=1519643 RepID=A0A1X7CT13_9BACT|nr:lytic transglycosylase F [Desulfovibrio gilichinskyi]SMF02326.1 Membrane-bound lytic murein transglycosylase MltF [Desulfovibrio gilichinskyi]
MKNLLSCLFISLCLIFLTSACNSTPESSTRTSKKWKLDLPDILKDKLPIRVLVCYNRTNFFTVKGATKGLEHDLMLAYKKYLSKESKDEQVRMVFIALPFEELIPALLEGRGDIIAAGLTVTSNREKKVAFASSYMEGISDIVVGSRKADPISKLTDLAGKTVYVMAGSSYKARLEALNSGFKKKGLKTVNIVQADKHLVTEDLLEMAERSMIEYTVAESHIAELWKTALPDIRLYKDAPLHIGGEVAWAVRPSSKELQKSLSEFAATVRQGTLMGNMVFKRYFVNTSWVLSPSMVIGWKEMQPLTEVFKKYGEKYNFDWLKLLAVAYQESGLDMNKSSHRGAVGIMQIKPSTAADKNVDVKNINTLDGNVHAGAKYLRFLRDRYFKDVAKDAQADFALAAYNAGPNRIIKLRKQAEDMGLDPDQWFGNVEYAAYKEIGAETPTYVANIQMNYAFYKSAANVLVKRIEVKK